MEGRSSNTDECSPSSSPTEKDVKRPKHSPSKTIPPSQSADTAVSSSPSSTNVFGNFATSPPNFVAMEEVMKAANGFANMYLAHEIALDPTYRLPDKNEVRKDGLSKQVEEVMKKAFWDILQSQLNETPPKYKQALSLLAEVKEELIGLLLPQHTSGLRKEIDEILDLELITQQVENGTLDFPRYAQYTLSVMARMCAPIRDERIRELTQITDVVEMFKGIMELLELMKLDWTNFTIEVMRPHIQQQSIEYEKKKFQEFLDSQTKIWMGEDHLLYTRKWLERSFKSADFSDDEDEMSIVNKVLSGAFSELLVWNDGKQEFFPETLVMDQSRFMAFRDKVSILTLIGSIIMVTYATVGPSIQSLAEFKETLKKHLILILADASIETGSKLESAALQVIKEVTQCLDTHGLPALSDEKKSSLLSQIKDLDSPDNRVRMILQRRVLEFVEGVSESTSTSSVQIPSGLSVLKEELLSITGQFMKLTTHNRRVFGDYYSQIISELVKGSKHKG